MKHTGDQGTQWGGPQLPSNFNIVEALLDSHVETGASDRVAIYYEDRRITYGQLFEVANRVGNALTELGVEMEDRVAILLPDSPEFVATFLGAVKMGAVSLPLNALATQSDYEYYLNDSRAKVLVASRDLLAKVESVRPKLKRLKHIIAVGGEGRYMDFQDWIKAAPPQLEAAATSRDDACYWLYTSGTTGQYKGVVHLHHDHMYCTLRYTKHILDMKTDGCTYSASKLFFSYGLNNSLFIPLLNGASTVLYAPRPEPLKVLEVIESYRPTLFFAVPTFYAALLRATERPERSYDLSSLRLCVSGGEPLPASIYERWMKRFDVQLLDGIGSTEVGYIYISNRPERVKPGSCGQLIPGYEAKIVGEDGKEVSAGSVGELWIKSVGTAGYYWNKHEKNKEAFIVEWFRTGDDLYRDEEGFYHFYGRRDDLVKVGGIWVSPIEVESNLLQHPAVSECCVVGVMDQDGLARLKAFVVVKEEYPKGAQLVQELQDFMRGKVAHYKVPRWIEVIDEIPKTSTGKMQRYRLRA